MKKMKKVTKSEFDYFMSKINFSESFLDAKAVDIMNRCDSLFENEISDTRLGLQCSKCQGCDFSEVNMGLFVCDKCGKRIDVLMES